MRIPMRKLEPTFALCALCFVACSSKAPTPDREAVDPASTVGAIVFEELAEGAGVAFHAFR